MVEIVRLKEENTEEKLSNALEAYSKYEIEEDALFECLLTSNVWIPCLIDLKQKDISYFKEVFESKRYQDLDLQPYLMEVEELEQGFYTCFSKSEALLDKQYTWFYISFIDYLHIVQNREDTSGIMVDPFLNQLAIPFEMLSELLEMAKEHYDELSTDYNQDKQILFNYFKGLDIEQAYFVECHSVLKNYYSLIVSCDSKEYQMIERELPYLGLKASPIVMEDYQYVGEVVKEFHLAPFYKPEFPSLPKYQILDFTYELPEAVRNALEDYEREDSDINYDQVFQLLDQMPIWIPSTCFLYDEQIDLFKEDFLKNPERYQQFFNFYRLAGNNRNAFLVYSRWEYIPQEYKGQYTWLHISYSDMIKVLHFHPKFHMLLIDYKHASFVIQRKQAVQLLQ